MPFDRQSKIRDVWEHPVGHDMLQTLIDKSGKSEYWIRNALVSNMPVSLLDRVAGTDFVDVLLEMTDYEADRIERQKEEPHVWWKEVVHYQVFLPSFMDSDHDGVGDLGGVIQRLPYLESLGVGALWLWPLTETSEDGGVTDFRRVASEFGDMETLKSLVEAAHQRGIRVLIGLDINTTSDQHPWFKTAVSGGETKELYVFRKGSSEKPPNNWSHLGQSKVWKWVPEANAWALRLCGHSKMDLNWENPEVRAEMEQVLRFWSDAGIDGFSLGTVSMMSKKGFEDGSTVGAGLVGICGFEKFGFGPRMHRYLRELRSKAIQNTEMLVAGEVIGVGTEMAKLLTDPRRKELDLVLDTSHVEPIRKGKSGEIRMDLEDIKQYYVKWMEQYGNDYWKGIVFEGPRLPRLVSQLGASPVYRSILAKLLATMLLTLRGVPLIYQGEELGMPNVRFKSPDELRDRRTIDLYKEFCTQMPEPMALQKASWSAPDQGRMPIPWNPGPNAGFTGATPWMRLPDGVDFLNASTQMEDGASVWRYYQKLISLRKKYSCLVYGDINIVFKKNKKVFCYFRIYGNEKWYVEMNLTEKEASRPGRILRTQKLMLSNYDSPARALRPYEANLYLCE